MFSIVNQERFIRMDFVILLLIVFKKPPCEQVLWALTRFSNCRHKFGVIPKQMVNISDCLESKCEQNMENI